MAAGGKWIIQNKRRPGPYINFVAKSKPLGVMSTRGVVAVALPMTWGPIGELIELYGSDLLDGKSLAKVGCTVYDTQASLPFRTALAGCYKALLYRANINGIKASGTLEDSFNVTAKYEGSTGNNLAITVDSGAEGVFNVNVLFNGVTKETFTVTTLAGLEDIESDFVEFEAIEGGTLKATSGVTLAGGTNGELISDYTEFFNLIKHESWQCMAIQSDDTTLVNTIATNITHLRDNTDKKVQAVVYSDTPTDHEGIICVNQGFVAGEDTVGTNLFPVWVASITAGANINESNTGRVVPDATKIINALDDNEIEDALAEGRFILSYRQDGAVIVEQDINSLHTFTTEKPYSFSKNRVIRCLDAIATNSSYIFNVYFKGKVDNNSIGRNLYKSHIIKMMEDLQAMNAVQNFEGPTDVDVLPGEQVDSVVVGLYAQPVDSMEKMYMTVTVG